MGACENNVKGCCNQDIQLNECIVFDTAEDITKLLSFTINQANNVALVKHVISMSKKQGNKLNDSIDVNNHPVKKGPNLILKAPTHTYTYTHTQHYQ